MTRILLDTNILLRESNKSDTHHGAVRRALDELHEAGNTLAVTPQVLIEFRNATTRPLKYNGLGYTTSDAEHESQRLQRLFPLLPDTPDIFPAWESIVRTCSVSGTQVHDARLVAVCHVHNVASIMTMNVRDFRRYELVGPGISILNPVTI